jgi:3-oxoacyl-[acyl-carrier-protein] synthase-1
MADSVGSPMRVALAPDVDPATAGIERYWQLLRPALDQIATAIAELFSERCRVRLLLALPPRRPGRPDDLERGLERQIATRYSSRFVDVTPFTSGHAAGYVAFDVARRCIEAGDSPVCVVAGVDSYAMPATLRWLESRDQISGAGRLNNAWGFTPGEGACAIALCGNGSADRYRGPVLGQVVSIGIGRESRLLGTDAVCVGEGLTAAVRAAIGALEGEQRIDNVTCDLNGEPYRADEFGFTAVRVKDRVRAASAFVAPAEFVGDLGAAGAPLHVALSVVAHCKGYSKGPLSLTFGSSESGERGAAVVAAATRC